MTKEVRRTWMEFELMGCAVSSTTPFFRAIPAIARWLAVLNGDRAAERGKTLLRSLACSACLNGMRLAEEDRRDSDQWNFMGLSAASLACLVQTKNFSLGVLKWDDSDIWARVLDDMVSQDHEYTSVRTIAMFVLLPGNEEAARVILSGVIDYMKYYAEMDSLRKDEQEKAYEIYQALSCVIEEVSPPKAKYSGECASGN